jgi:hypothetical protein
VTGQDVEEQMRLRPGLDQVDAVDPAALAEPAYHRASYSVVAVKRTPESDHRRAHGVNPRRP